MKLKHSSADMQKLEVVDLGKSNIPEFKAEHQADIKSIYCSGGIPLKIITGMVKYN